MGNIMISFGSKHDSFWEMSKVLNGKVLTEKTKFETVIIDLGIGKDKVDKTGAWSTALGNEFIRAPEGFMDEKIHDDIYDKRYMDGADHPKSDLYSIGVNLIKLLCPDKADDEVRYFFKHSEDTIKARLAKSLRDNADPVQVLLKEVLF